MNRRSFLKGAVILGIAGLVTQVLGAVFRIPLGNIIGTDGMAYYGAAYTIYIFLLVFSTNGAPAAISKMISERIALGHYREANRVFRLSFIFMTIFGLLAFLIVFLGADAIGTAIGNEGSVPALKAIAPALLFVPVMAVYRGYFQGMQAMGPTAVSQLCEQSIRVIIGLTLAVVFFPRGLETAAAGAAAGGSIGPVFGILVLIIVYFRNKKSLREQIESDISNIHESSGHILKTLTGIAVPITIGVSIQPIMNLCDTIFVMNRLQNAAGFSVAESEELFGALTGFAIPVINVPMALALSMALSMVPAVSAAQSAGDYDFMRSNIRLGFRTAMIIGVPCSFGLMSLAEPVMLLLFPLQPDEVSTSANCLFILAAGVIFLCIAQTMAGILQGIGHAAVTVWGIAAGVIVKCVATFVLSGIPEHNVEGAAFGTLLGYLAIALVNMTAVKKITGVRYDLVTSIVKPLAAGGLMTVVVVFLYNIVSPVLGNSITTILSIGAGACVYVVTFIKIKGITSDEICMLPKGEKLEKLLRKLRLI